jgi:hypothetical protein
LFGCVFYWLFASGEVQKWAIQEPVKNEIEGKKSDVEKNGKSFAYSNEGIELKED